MMRYDSDSSCRSKSFLELQQLSGSSTEDLSEPGVESGGRVEESNSSEAQRRNLLEKMRREKKRIEKSLRDQVSGRVDGA